MFKRYLIATILGLTISGSGFATDEINAGRELAVRLDQRDKGYKDSKAELTMTISNKSGDSTVRKLDLQLLEVVDGGDKSLMVFRFPADIRGTALLSHPKSEADDEQWLYLPSIKRVKRIASKNKTGSFVGSEFTFEDLTDKDVDDYRYTHLGYHTCGLSLAKGEEKEKQVPCEKLERIALDEHSGYSKQILTIDSEALRILAIEYFDVRGDLLKKLVSGPFVLFENRYWRPRYVDMQNVQTGKSTRLEYDSIAFDVKLKEADFTRAALQR